MTPINQPLCLLLRESLGSFPHSLSSSQVWGTPCSKGKAAELPSGEFSAKMTGVSHGAFVGLVV